MVYVQILCKRYLQLKITAVILAIRPYTPLEMLKQTWIIDHLLHDYENFRPCFKRHEAIYCSK